MSNENIKLEGFEACAKGLREFGYPDVTASKIEAIHDKWIKGEDQSMDVIAMFATKDFAKYPEIFGEPA